MQSSSSSAPVRQHAIQHFARLGYSIIDGAEEEHGNCSVTDRQNSGEVVLWSRLRQALYTLNPDCTPAQIEKAIDGLTDGLSLLSLAHANEAVYTRLKDGIKIDARGQIVTTDNTDNADHMSSNQARENTYKTVHVIDWRESEQNQNDFTLVSRFWVNGKLGKRCLDLVGFVNGLPFILLEIADSELPNILARIDQDYKASIPSLFWYNAFMVVADAFTCKMGSLTASWEYFFQWKRIEDENEKESTRLDTLIEGTCQKERLLDIVENFTLFDKSNGLNKLVGRNHQYLGVNNAIASLRAWERERQAWRQTGEPEPHKQHGKLGVFWHTQGSGKSYSMVFFVRKVQRKVANNYTFVVVTDREDLDDQIYKNFFNTGTIIEDEKLIHAGSGKQLKRLLSEKHLLLFTLIQKFRSDKPGQDYEEISDNENIIVMADEAHRTQYDTLAKNMRNALPRASFIGFTGTPLMDGEEQTRETFGHYVSTYNFRRAINDGITVPLYYENHTPQINITNGSFQEEMAEILEKAALDERQEQKITEQYAHAENFVVTGERLDNIANHIVSHFMQRGYMGKAMVVSINKITAVRTYNRVWERWQSYREELETQLAQESDPDARIALAGKIDYMKMTGMAVVVSSSDGDVERFAKFSAEYGEQVEILPHHQRFKTQKLDEDFKKADHPLRIAFVCAMWITGFDVPCLSTIYLDRPLKGHTLMQTIARANRVYQDKNNGLIVDYAGNKEAQKKALAIYAREDSSYQEGDRPIGDKSDLVKELRKALAGAEQFCHEQGIDVQKLQAEFANKPNKAERQALIDGVVNTLVTYDELKLNALLIIALVSRLYKAILPDATEREFTLPVHLFRLIQDGINATMRPDKTDYFRAVQGSVTRLVRESTEIAEQEERFSPDTHEPRGHFDLRDVDLDALNTNLRSGYRHINIERWRHALYERIMRMIEVNPSEVQYMEKLERAVQRYNEGCANFASDPRLINPQAKIRPYPTAEAEQEQLEDEYIDALGKLTGEIAQEEQRPEQEGLSAAEIAIFDQLASEVSLAEEERTQVKEIAHSLLAKLHATFDNVPDWQKKQDIFSRVYVLIEDELCKLPSVYSGDLFDQKRDALFRYVREHYKNDGGISVA